MLGIMLQSHLSRNQQIDCSSPFVQSKSKTRASKYEVRVAFVICELKEFSLLVSSKWQTMHMGTSAFHTEQTVFSCAFQMVPNIGTKTHTFLSVTFPAKS